MFRKSTTLNITVKLVALTALVVAATPSDASAQRILNGIANIVAAANGQTPNQTNRYTTGHHHVNTNRNLPVYVLGGTHSTYSTNQNRTVTNRPFYSQQQGQFNQQTRYHGQNNNLMNASPHNLQQINQQSGYNTNGNQGFHTQQANYNGSFNNRQQQFNNQRQQFNNQSNVQSGVNQSTLNFLHTITGRYERRPIQNGYHVATITRVGNAYRFSVSNGGSWDLTLDMANQQLLKYYNDQAGQPQVDSFKFAVGQGGNVIGFHFRGVFFTRTP